MTNNATNNNTTTTTNAIDASMDNNAPMNAAGSNATNTVDTGANNQYENATAVNLNNTASRNETGKTDVDANGVGNMGATNAVNPTTTAGNNADNTAGNNGANSKRVAIEPNLGPIQQYLQQQGYQCEQLNQQNASAQGYSAIIISGADRNLMGIQNATTLAPVINAEGLTPQDVAQRLQQLQ